MSAHKNHLVDGKIEDTGLTVDVVIAKFLATNVY